jgi:hypothetical protein
MSKSTTGCHAVLVCAPLAAAPHVTRARPYPLRALGRLAEAPIEIRLSGISSRDARIFVEANERNALVINARRLTAHDEASI